MPADFAFHLRGFSGVVPSLYRVQWVNERSRHKCRRSFFFVLFVFLRITHFRSLLYLALHFTKKQTQVRVGGMGVGRICVHECVCMFKILSAFFKLTRRKKNLIYDKCVRTNCVDKM